MTSGSDIITLLLGPAARNPNPISAAQYADSSDYRSNDDADQTVAAQLRYAYEGLFNQYQVSHRPHAPPGRSAGCSQQQRPCSRTTLPNALASAGDNPLLSVTMLPR